MFLPTSLPHSLSVCVFCLKRIKDITFLPALIPTHTDAYPAYKLDLVRV